MWLECKKGEKECGALGEETQRGEFRGENEH